MNNDLISRSALKEDVKTLFCPDGYKLLMLNRIDNAPAVEILDKERPKGEWIFVARHCYKCPFCQELSIEGNFCPNCGADMRG